MPLRRKSWPLPPEPTEQPDGYGWVEIVLTVAVVFAVCLTVVYFVGKAM